MKWDSLTLSKAHHCYHCYLHYQYHDIFLKKAFNSTFGQEEQFPVMHSLMQLPSSHADTQNLTQHVAAIDFGEGPYWNVLRIISCFHTLHMRKISGKCLCSTWSLCVFSGKNKTRWKLHSPQICSKTNSRTRNCLQNFLQSPQQIVFCKYLFFPCTFLT